MKLYDSLTKKLKDFPEGDADPITIYACGPTVYHYASIGNLRTFLTVDLLRRYLEYRGRKVKLVMNITDVGHMLNDADVGEDKMEAAAAKEGKTPEEIARFYEKAFFRDMDALNFKRAWKNPRATEHIPQMEALIEQLLDDGRAYITENGDVYFDVASFKGYGKLSGNSVDDLVAGARVEVKGDKHHPADFALWINNPKHVMQWKGPRGIQGYPGWHIECSAMAKKYLGETIDLHVGGEDLKFPHHECEIAQSESANGAQFALHWLHVSFLLVEGEKMSKSKGNTYTLSDLVAKGYSPEAVRWLLLSAHYRTQLNFTLEGLEAAKKEIAYYCELRRRLEDQASNGPAGTYDEAEITFAPKMAKTMFVSALEKDLNVSAVMAALATFASGMNRFMDEGRLVASLASDALDFLSDVEAVIGVNFSITVEETPDDIQKLAAEREAARANKDFKESDRLRDEIAEKGWIVEDTPQGQKLKKA